MSFKENLYDVLTESPFSTEEISSFLEGLNKQASATGFVGDLGALLFNIAPVMAATVPFGATLLAYKLSHPNIARIEAGKSQVKAIEDEIDKHKKHPRTKEVFM